MPVILYTKSKSEYLHLGVECYGKEKNALTYQGNDVVICHPPCAHWGSMSHFASIEPAEKYLALHALWLVESLGGILEHPAQSKLWKLVKSNRENYKGSILSVNMSWFGFPTQKRTYLYIKGASLKEIPAHPITFDRVTTFIRTNGKKNTKHLPKSQRDTTPLSMCEWLIKIAWVIEKNKNETGLSPAIDQP